ncbi:MAG: hypothetical protein LBD13_03730 [Spirochaetaceae bacterium]|jgi:hypothetical protein|nr:hypothetical protein [Spirochaetaceae bacterium]
MCAAILSCACTRNTSEITIVPPPTHPLSRSVIGYGVVSNPYTRVVLDPDRSEVSLGYLRRGSVVRVIERRSVNNRGTAESWVLVEGNYQGWLPEMVIDIYDLEAKAATAAEFMTQ